ncbi:hypothetical protein AKJ65_03000 [candidate division MSBL1 archaeon SCGC-AAA259E19]|uniref:Uncharacterized protein n=1 Tax=candidate division MSBL1 archaeon SCGC-AAA259E19 TaxID=1698264 RepID=A0A133UL93_9EURY|nr:hypothetical protein AKJ65_03000 [candidate division MSBL1 archaeon SCGC-AAA259E19]
MKSYDKQVKSSKQSRQDKGTKWWRVSFSQTFFERSEEKGFTCINRFRCRMLNFKLGANYVGEKLEI